MGWQAGNRTDQLLLRSHHRSKIFSGDFVRDRERAEQIEIDGDAYTSIVGWLYQAGQ